MVKMYTIEDLEKSRNNKLLSQFMKYCLDHPDERFWQALTNWSGATFILSVDNRDGKFTVENLESLPPNIKDTYNWENKNGN